MHDLQSSKENQKWEIHVTCSIPVTSFISWLIIFWFIWPYNWRYDLADDHESPNKINVFYCPSQIEGRYYTCSFFYLKKIKIYLKIDLVIFKMTLKQQNNIRDKFPSQTKRIIQSKSHQKRYYSCSYLCLQKIKKQTNWLFDLESSKEYQERIFQSKSHKMT